MHLTSILITLLGLITSLSLWFFSLAIQNRMMESFSIFNGYPARSHIEMAIGLFFMPFFAVLLDKKGILKDAFPSFQKKQVWAALILLHGLLFIASFAAQIIFHSLLFIYILIVWLASGSLKQERTGKNTDDFFGLALLLSLSGAALWILYDFTDFSNAYLAGKILFVYGSMNLVFFGILPSFTHTEINLKNLRWFIYIYLGSIIYEILLMIFFKERPPVIIGNGIRLLVSAYWFFGLIRIQHMRKTTVWKAGLWAVTVFHLAGLFGLTVLSETGIHYGHLYLAGALTPLFLFAIFNEENSNDSKRKEIFQVLILFALIFFATLTRVTAHLMPEINHSHLAYASFVMISGILLLVFRNRKPLF